MIQTMVMYYITLKLTRMTTHRGEGPLLQKKLKTVPQRCGTDLLTAKTNFYE